MKFESLWGYSSNSEFGFFPANNFSDKLSLTLVYSDGVKYEAEVSEIIETGINRLSYMYDINKSRIKVFDEKVDPNSIIIRIEF